MTQSALEMWVRERCEGKCEAPTFLLITPSHHTLQEDWRHLGFLCLGKTNHQKLPMLPLWLSHKKKKGKLLEKSFAEPVTLGAFTPSSTSVNIASTSLPAALGVQPRQTGRETVSLFWNCFHEKIPRPMCLLQELWAVVIKPLWSYWVRLSY